MTQIRKLRSKRLTHKWPRISGLGDNMEDGNFDIGNLAWYENEIVREI